MTQARAAGRVGIYFSDFFEVDKETLESYGAFNVSLVNDLPLFIDPFLLFDSTNSVYQGLHEQIIGYLKFLRDVSATGALTQITHTNGLAAPRVNYRIRLVEP